ncbi:IucA/IucC family protein [Phytohabitans houttuyneae]|uniref:IucA/IucC family protein n=1 Tax=Phytohabitans houttuyneae TaxID=1076126 RepID=UPI001FE39CDB|nr:IucA/IucC family protein [Phytohabitans houttuyneae]
MHAPDPAATRAALHRDRPDLLAPFDRELPGARAAVLARLWGAYAREPVPGLLRRARSGGRLTVHTGAGVLDGPADAAEPYAPAAGGLTVHLDGAAHTDPAALARALGHPGFAVEVDNSVANLALARAAPARAPALTATLPQLEQSVVDGHPLHPCCRTRLGMSTLDVLRYAPSTARSSASTWCGCRRPGGTATARPCCRSTLGSTSTCWTRTPGWCRWGACPHGP